MKRIIMMVLKNILTIPSMLLQLIIQASNPKKYTDEQHNDLFKTIVRRANKGGKVKLEVYGKENIPQKDGFIFYPNHQGMYDVLAIVGSADKYFGTIAKKEVRNVFFLKQIFKCSGSYTIDREDIKQSMKVILNVTKDVKSGKNFLIFAEGTRSKKGNNTLEFKGGSFKAAMKANAPIVPVALVDAFKPFDINSIKSVTVGVHYLKPITVDEYSEMSSTEVAIEVRNRIQTVLDTYKNEK